MKSRFSDQVDDWLRSVDPDGPGVVPARGRCQWPIIGRWLHRWGAWEPALISYQDRRCADCGLTQRKWRMEL